MTRPRGSHIKVFVTPEERGKIEGKAQAANLSLSAYLRALALNHKIRSRIDLQAVADLAKSSGELGAHVKVLQSLQESGLVDGCDVKEKINELRELQTEIHDAMGRVIR